MNQTHSVPEIYNPDVPYEVKCEIVTQLCRMLAYHKNMTPDDLRKYLLEKTHVDFENLHDNPVGMLLLYEYLHSQRPQACDGVKENFHCAASGRALLSALPGPRTPILQRGIVDSTLSSFSE